MGWDIDNRMTFEEGPKIRAGPGGNVPCADPPVKSKEISTLEVYTGFQRLKLVLVSCTANERRVPQRIL